MQAPGHLFIFSKYIYCRKQITRFTTYTFSSNHNIHKSSCGMCFWASNPLILLKSCQLKWLKHKNQGHMNFYECFYLTKKYTTYLSITYCTIGNLPTYLHTTIKLGNIKYLSGCNMPITELKYCKWKGSWCSYIFYATNFSLF